ncbi:MAG: glycosyltransferase family 2 protein [Proteobacteria bacterium]|nr:glycosyltransferase family 2 protein [Pseudomonadota bacterium]
MARVTVGVPVYNGAPMLRECLDCLLSQTFQDISIVISDNASTDETPEICAEYAAKDSRIRVVRHSENMGPLANFRYLLDHADTEFFMWRADDDLSDEHFVKELVAVLDANPKSQLAIPRIVTEHENHVRTIESSFQPIDGIDLADRVVKRLYNYHVSGFYGLWRKKYLHECVSRIWSAYPEPYAGDHLTMLPAFLEDVAIGSDRTLYVQRTYSPPKGDGLRGKPRLSDRVALYERLLPKFYACFDAEVRRRAFPAEQEARILRERRRFTRTRLRASPWRVFRLKVKLLARRLFGSE